MKRMKKPLVTVLMPAYNADRYIAEAIESILDQTFRDFEFIICDDGSTDRTWQIIQDHAIKDNRIKQIKNEKNLGIVGSRNMLISVAMGDYIAWQDADDISMQYRLERQYEFMEGHHEVAILGGWLQFFNEKGNWSIRKYATADAQLRRTIFRYSPVAQPGSMIRKKCLDAVGTYDLNRPVAEDLDMSFRLGVKYKFANLPEVVLMYRENDSSSTFTRLKALELNTIEIRKKYSRGCGYTMSLTDKIYNLVHYISIFLVSPRVKIKLFSFMRNCRRIS